MSDRTKTILFFLSPPFVLALSILVLVMAHDLLGDLPNAVVVIVR